MMGRTHSLVGGSTAFVATSAIGLPWPYVGIAVACAMATSSLPDIDQKVKFIPHRRLTHYPALQLAFFALVVFIVTIAAPGLAGLAAAIAIPMAFGCVVHSCADAMTVDRHGIALLWPISRRGFHLLPYSMRVSVGSKSRSEKVFVVVWMLVVLSYAYARFGLHISS